MDQLLYKEEHFSCLRYKANVELGFRFVNVEKGVSFEGGKKDFHQIIFLLKGKLSAAFGVNQVFESKDFFLIPKSTDFSCCAQEASSLLVFMFDSLVSVCEKMQLQSYASVSLELDGLFKTLVINRHLEQFILLLQTYFDNSINCEHLHVIKHQELFLLLRGYYAKEDLAAFFHPIVGKYYDFRNLILENYLKVGSLDELIQLSGMGRTSFNLKFKKEFNMPAHQWMLKQKAKHVRYKLSEPGITLSDIMMQFNFSSATQLTRFCKQQFGCTPTELRKQLGDSNRL